MYVTTLYIYHCYSISSFFTLFSFPTGYGMHLALVAHTTIQEVTTTTMNHCSISCMVLCRKFWYTGCTTWTWFFFDFSLTTPCVHKKIWSGPYWSPLFFFLCTLPSSIWYILVEHNFCWSQHLCLALSSYCVLCSTNPYEGTEMTRYWWSIIDADVICTACY